MNDPSVGRSKAERATQQEVEASASEAAEERFFGRTGDPEYDLKKRRLDLGWIGRIFGGKEEKAGNIAVAAIIMAFVMVFAMFLVDAYVKSVPYGQVVVTGGISIITAALGYVCGVEKSSNDRNPN